MSSASISKLQSLFDSGALQYPPTVKGASLPCLVHLARAISELCGGKTFTMNEVGSEKVNFLKKTIGEGKHYVFVVLDGLGMNLLEPSIENVDFLRNHVATVLTSVFLSTTAAAITSIHTGLYPSTYLSSLPLLISVAQHCLPSWFTDLPKYKLTSAPLPFVERSSLKKLSEWGITTEEVYLFDPLFQHFKENRIGYKSVEEAVDLLFANLKKHATEDTFSYFYIPNVDKAEHVHGVYSNQTMVELRRCNEALEKIITQSKADNIPVCLFATADHGQVDLQEIRIPEDDPLIKMLEMQFSGDPRVPFFRVKPGLEKEFETLFNQRLGQHFHLISVDDAEEMNLFGDTPMDPEMKWRVGSYVAISLDRSALLLQSSPQKYTGQHGSLLPEEMKIPLIVARSF